MDFSYNKGSFQSVHRLILASCALFIDITESFKESPRRSAKVRGEILFSN